MNHDFGQFVSKSQQVETQISSTVWEHFKLFFVLGCKIWFFEAIYFDIFIILCQASKNTNYREFFLKLLAYLLFKCSLQMVKMSTCRLLLFKKYDFVRRKCSWLNASILIELFIILTKIQILGNFFESLNMFRFKSHKFGTWNSNTVKIQGGLRRSHSFP